MKMDSMTREVHYQKMEIASLKKQLEDKDEDAMDTIKKIVSTMTPVDVISFGKRSEGSSASTSSPGMSSLSSSSTHSTVKSMNSDSQTCVSNSVKEDARWTQKGYQSEEMGNNIVCVDFVLRSATPCVLNLRYAHSACYHVSTI